MKKSHKIEFMNEIKKLKTCLINLRRKFFKNKTHQEEQVEEKQKIFQHRLCNVAHLHGDGSFYIPSNPKMYLKIL